MNFGNIENLCRGLKGRIGFYYKDLTGSEEYGICENDAFTAASIIKLPVLVEAFRQFSIGTLNEDDIVVVNDKDRVPSCGAMAYLQSGTRLALRDICTWMIILSDNMAANVVAGMLKFENINNTMDRLGLKKTRMNRLFYDSAASGAGVSNYFAPAEMGRLLQLAWEGKLVSKKASGEIIRILKLQQVNYKMPSLLPQTVEVAHKTGEDDYITHDVGIVYAKRPFVLCFAANDTDVVETEQFIRRASRFVFDMQNGQAERNSND